MTNLAGSLWFPGHDPEVSHRPPIFVGDIDSGISNFEPGAGYEMLIGFGIEVAPVHRCTEPVILHTLGFRRAHCGNQEPAWL